MKKLFLILFVLAFAASSWADWKSDVWDPSQQYSKAIEGRAILDGVTQQLEQAIPEFKALKDSGQFDTLPQWAKDALLRWYNILKAARDQIAADSEIMDIYQFRP